MPLALAAKSSMGRVSTSADPERLEASTTDTSGGRAVAFATYKPSWTAIRKVTNTPNPRIPKVQIGKRSSKTPARAPARTTTRTTPIRAESTTFWVPKSQRGMLVIGFTHKLTVLKVKPSRTTSPPGGYQGLWPEPRPTDQLQGEPINWLSAIYLPCDGPKQ